MGCMCWGCDIKINEWYDNNVGWKGNRLFIWLVKNHKKWIDFALSLGCETLRLNLSGENDIDKWIYDDFFSIFGSTSLG